MNRTEPRVVVLGAGRWGRNLVRVFGETGTLAAVVDPDPAARAAVAQLIDVPIFAHVDAISDPVARELTAAAIATPAESHAHLALRCLDRDLDLFVEKPLTLSVEDAEHLVAQAERRGRVLMTGHLLLYHPAIVALKQIIDAGELGEIRYVYSNRLNLGRVRREENILWSFAPHDVATILHLLGDVPVRVDATGGNWLHCGVADVTVTHLEFPRNRKAHVFVSWLHPYKEQKLVVVGSRRMAVFNDLEPEAKLVLSDVGVDVTEDGTALERRDGSRTIPVPKDEPLRCEIDHFLDRCRDRRPPLTDGRHGTAVLRVLAAAEKALRGSVTSIDMRAGNPR